MRKLVILFLTLAAVSFGSQRIVVAEKFTATWCPYCPGGARGMDEIYTRSYDSLVVIDYHSDGSDPFFTAEAAQRRSYYGNPGYPNARFDGINVASGGQTLGNNYPMYRNCFDQRINIPSLLEISLDCSYDSVSNSGSATAIISNTSTTPVIGDLHFVIIENDIPFNWQGMTELHFVMRDMLPTASGEAVTIPASDTIMRSRNFTTDPTWEELNCKIVAFVQAATREIYQGSEIALVPEPEVTYYGLSLLEISGNGNGFTEPGEGVETNIFGKNIGDGVYTGWATVECTDPYITITGSNPTTVSIEPGDVDTLINLTFDVSTSCPEPHTVEFQLTLETGDTSTLPFMITTQPGFSDDIESGEAGWTHSGTRDNWHITEHNSNSPTHSWYCGLEGSWLYTNENDASLISPYFVATPESTISFYHQYSLETDWDYGYVEVDNGSGWWRTLTDVTGSLPNWTQAYYPLNEYSGQTIRIRFRFISDYGITWEGWYVDDVIVPTYVGIRVQNTHHTTRMPLLRIHPNPFRHNTDIRYQISDSGIENNALIACLRIYDACGKLVKNFRQLSVIGQQLSVTWDGTDQVNRQLGSGVYFLKFKAGNYSATEKVLLIR